MPEMPLFPEAEPNLNFAGGRCCLPQSEDGPNKINGQNRLPCGAPDHPPNPLMGQMGMESGPADIHKSHTFTARRQHRPWLVLCD